MKVVGIAKLQKKFGRLAEEVVKAVDVEMGIASNDYVNRAQDDANRFTDEGILKGQITRKKVAVMHHEVVSGAAHSAYLEFGTKRKRRVPADLTGVAQQSQGKGGKAGGKGFYDNILGWVKRKGIAAKFATTGSFNVKTRKRSDGTSKVERQIEEEQVAYAIYLSIMRNGISPQPFFFKHREPVYKEMMQKIRNEYRKALSK